MSSSSRFVPRFSSSVRPALRSGTNTNDLVLVRPGAEREVVSEQATTFSQNDAREGGAVTANLLEQLVASVVDEVLDRLASRLPVAPAEAQEPWQLVGVDEVATALGRSKRWVHGAVKERGLPFIRLDGGALAFDLEDVKSWALARRVPAVADDPLAARLQVSGKPAARAASNGRSRTDMQRVSA